MLSRLSKEIDKRFLHVTDLMKIKGVVWERQAETKKERVGDNLYTELRPEDQDERRAETVWNYLEVMEMYMLAMAIVGTEPMKPLPEAPETVTSDPTDYVMFPYQYSLDYRGRARALVQATLKKCTPNQAYEMLKELDRAERQKWVDKFRTHEKESIGKVFAEVWRSNKEDWKCKHLPVESGRPAREKELEAQVRQLREKNAAANSVRRGIQSSKGGGKDKGGKKGSKGGGKRGTSGTGNPVTVEKMMNGKRLCAEWNAGGCSRGSKCQKTNPELHLCNGRKRGTSAACAGKHPSNGCGLCEQQS